MLTKMGEGKHYLTMRMRVRRSDTSSSILKYLQPLISFFGQIGFGQTGPVFDYCDHFFNIHQSQSFVRFRMITHDQTFSICRSPFEEGFVLIFVTLIIICDLNKFKKTLLVIFMQNGRLFSRNICNGYSQSFNQYIDIFY